MVSYTCTNCGVLIKSDFEHILYLCKSCKELC